MMGGMGQGMMGDMQTIHQLFANHKSFKRTIKNTSSGIEVLTESTDPKAVPLLQEHVAAMKVRLEKKQPIRQGDPLFAVLFDNADKVKMSVENTKTGVKIIETSDDPYTVKILQAHAQAVSGFVRDGMPGMMRRHPAPLKDGQKPVKEPHFIGKGNGVKTCPVMGGSVDPHVSLAYKGKTIKFCCPSCKATFLKAPTRYLK